MQTKLLDRADFFSASCTYQLKHFFRSLFLVCKQFYAPCRKSNGQAVHKIVNKMHTMHQRFAFFFKCTHVK